MLFLDLSIDADVAKMLRLMDHPQLAYLHVAPPCGTCSRAREIRHKELPGGGPPVLRTEVHPLGLPDLEQKFPHLAPRVTAANKVYDSIAQLVRKAKQRGTLWSMENPRNSILWLIPCIKDLCEVCFFADFQACMFGGARPKWTRFAHGPTNFLKKLCRTCDGSHSHAPWGRSATGSWATSLETVYPLELCTSIAQIVLDSLMLQPSTPLTVVRSKAGPLPAKTRDDRISAGVQPRGLKLRRLLPEYKEILTVTGEFAPSDSRCSMGHQWNDEIVNGTAIPKGATTLRAEFAGAEGSPSGKPHLLAPPLRGCIRDVLDTGLLDNDVYIGRAHRSVSGKCLAASIWANPHRLRDCRDIHDCLVRFRSYLLSSRTLLDQLPSLAGKRLLCHCALGSPCHGDILIEEFLKAVAAPASACKLSVGVFRSPGEFAALAAGCRHPFEDIYLDALAISALSWRMATSPADIAAFRAAVLRHWATVATELAPQERALHKSLHPDVEAIISSKRVLLFRKMLAAIEFPQADELVHYFCTGFPVLGEYRGQVSSHLPSVLLPTRLRTCGAGLRPCGLGSVNRRVLSSTPSSTLPSKRLHRMRSERVGFEVHSKQPNLMSG